MSHQHVPSSSFHQTNKSHTAGKHDTKGNLRKKQKGKVEARVSIKTSSKSLSKQDKRKQQRDIAQNKKNAILDRKRFGTLEGAPKIVAMVTLGPVEDTDKLFNMLLTHCGKSSAGVFGDNGPCTVGITAKQRLTLFNTSRDVMDVLDIAKVADILLLVVPAEIGIDKIGERFISVIKAQGVPNVYGIVEGVEKIPAKKQHEAKKNAQKALYQHFPDEPRVLPLDTAEDAAQVIRFVENCTVKNIHWREKRPYLFVDKLTSETEGDFATVRVTGYLRGGNMSANQLVHLPGYGDFQLKKIEMVNDPLPVGRVKPREEMADEYQPTVLAADEPDEAQEKLDNENDPDTLLNEQTWPTAEELDNAGKKKKKIPKGMSDIQAAWIIEENDDDDEEEVEDADGDKDMGALSDEGEKSDHEENGKDEEEDDDSDDGLTDIASIAPSVDSKVSKSELAEDDLMFPDEVEAPQDKPARLRFQKFRGLKSFRTTPWDPKENLPLDYGRIFQFGNFHKSMRKATDTSDFKIPAGSYIGLTLIKVPVAFVNAYDPKKPCIVSALFKYENKMSVLQFNLTKHHTYDKPVASKDTLIFHVGMRRYPCQPIFSAASPGNPKQKFERFLQPGRPSCASIYGPVTFPPNPLLVFNPAGELVATGALHAVDPDRIIIKKIILTGRPYKVHKRNAVIRDMFYFPEDANWFRPVELWTKNGKVGHIKESVGTHGLIKCMFDNPILQHDTVCLSLYKRVFPKWPKVSPSFQYLQGSIETTTEKSEKSENMDE